MTEITCDYASPFLVTEIRRQEQALCAAQINKLQSDNRTLFRKLKRAEDELRRLNDYSDHKAQEVLDACTDDDPDFQDIADCYSLTYSPAR